MSADLFRVHWRDKKTGQMGHGEPLERGLAEIWADHMNAQTPDIFHWTEREGSGPASTSGSGISQLLAPFAARGRQRRRS